MKRKYNNNIKYISYALTANSKTEGTILQRPINGFHFFGTTDTGP